VRRSRRQTEDSVREGPPSLAEAVLKLFCPGRYRDQQAGDLREAFLSRLAREDRWKARRWYRRQVLISILPNVALSFRRRRMSGGEGRERTVNGPSAPLQDVSYLIRSFRRRPSFYLVVVLTYALGIGAATVVFSVVDGILLRPLPYPNSERLVLAYQTNPAMREADNPVQRRNWNRLLISFPTYEDWQEADTPLESLGIYTGADYIVTGGDRPERVSGIRATAGVFEALGVQATLGRVFIPSDDRRGTPGAVLLGHGLWQRRFGSDSTVVGRTMVLDEIPYRIVGIMPPGFSFPEESEVWTTFPDSYRDRPRFGRFASAIAALRPGVPLAQAQLDMEPVAQRLNRAHVDPSSRAWDYGVHLTPLKTDVVGDTRPAILLILGAVALVLVITCANNATILLLRASERRREMAVRSTLGAGRRRLLRQMLTEAVLLSAMGGGLGWLLAALSLRPFIALFPADTPRLAEIGLDHRVLAFGLTLSILTGLVAGLLPALAGSRTSLFTVLGDASPRAHGGRRRSRTQRALVVGEVAVTFVLLSGAALLTKSFLHLTSMELGFRSEALVTMRLDLRGPRYPSLAEVDETYRILEEELASLPGVIGVAGTGAGPFLGTWYSMARLGSGNDDPMVRVGTNDVTPSYHRVMGIPLLAGRFFSRQDQGGEPPVAIVNEQMAHTFWPTEEAVGRQLWLDGAWHTVVGVVGDVRRRLDVEPVPTVHRPVDYEERVLLLRTAVPPASVLPSIRDVVQATDPDLPILELTTMEQRINRSVALPRVRSVTVSSLAFLACVLALIGIFGVLASAVANRTNELGVRRALGATSGGIIRGVLGQGLYLSGLGLAIGLLVVLMIGRTVQRFLFQVEPLDPETLLLVGGMLLLATLAASFLPARRAAALDPVEALRRE
jgi:predicted permease